MNRLSTVRYRLSSIVGRLFISHIVVGALTTLLLVSVVGVFATLDSISPPPSEFVSYAESVAVEWLMPGRGLIAIDVDETTQIVYTPLGYSMIVTPDERVVFTEQAAPCTVGSLLADCAPDLINRPTGEYAITMNGEAWVEIVLPLATGERVIARYASPTSDNLITFLLAALPNVVTIIAQIILLVSVVSIPVSAVLVWLFARPLLRRIAQIVRVSQQFADGDLTVRIRDPRHDALSHLAQQFDTMADALQQNIFVLRDLLKTNATLTLQAETAATQTERLRLARDLHDDLAQRLFSLTVSSAAVPDLIAQDSAAGAAQARQVAHLAEQTLVSLRALLVDLRPGGLFERGLVGGLKVLCAQWEQTHHIKVDLSVMIKSDQFSASVQTALHHITQESLNNIAKHAHASHVAVSLVEGRQQIVLSISDNGRGFAMKPSSEEGHFGLITMRERAEALGGTLFVESETGRGTTIRVVLQLS